jgi:hypothetical protein
MNKHYIRDDEFDDEGEYESPLPEGWWVGIACYTGMLCVISFFLGRAFA